MANFQFDDWVIEPAAYRLLKSGQPVRIEPKALEVLMYLVERRERVVTKQELLDDVWRGTVVTENALTRAVAQIRKVLGDDLQAPRYIQTVPTKGYRFIAGASAGVTAPLAPSPAPPPPVTAPSSTWWRVVTALLVLTILILITSLIATTARKMRPFGPKEKLALEREGPSPLAARPLRPVEQLQSFPSFSPDGLRIAYAMDSGGNSHIFVSGADGTDEKQITNGDGESQPAWSPDGKAIAFVSLRRGGIWIAPVEGGEPTQLTTFGTRPRWSPDGSEIAFQSGETIEYGWMAFDALPPSVIWIANITTGRMYALTQPGAPLGGHGAPSWRSDGNRLSFSSCDVERCGIFTIARDGSGLAQIVTDSRRLSSPVFARDGRALLYILSRYNDSLLLTVPISSDGQRAEQNPRRLRQSGPGAMQHLAVSPDGFRLAWSLVEESSDLFSIGAKGGVEETQLTRNPRLRSSYPAFSPDGSRIAYSAVAAGVDSGVWVMNRDGNNAKAVAVGPGLKQHTGWLRDGSIVYSAWSEGAALFQVSLITGNSAPITRLPRDASAPVISPDGSTVAFNRTFGGLSIWSDMAAGSDPQRVTKVADLARNPRWSPDGLSLAVEARGNTGSVVGVVPANGGAVRLITNQRGESLPYGWSPDGKFISFAGRRDGVWNIYSVPAGGGAERRITNNESTTPWFRSPAWSPLGDRIVYEKGKPQANVWVSVE